MIVSYSDVAGVPLMDISSCTGLYKKNMYPTVMLLQPLRVTWSSCQWTRWRMELMVIDYCYQ